MQKNKIMLTESIGTVGVMTDSSGSFISKQRYYPYGETRLAKGTTYANKLFTSQGKIASLGIHHYLMR